MLKVCAISDLHGHLPTVPPCDLLLIAGDITGGRTVSDQDSWLRKSFRPWLEHVPAKETVGIAGNHDWYFQIHHPPTVAGLKWHYLQDSSVELFGLKIYGTPWQPRFFDWAFNLDEPDLAKRWELIPGDTDILITHGPPHGYGDLTDRGERVGSPSLTEAVKRVQPKLHVFGHIHSGRGVYQIGVTAAANVAIVNEAYEMVHEPMVFEL